MRIQINALQYLDDLLKIESLQDMDKPTILYLHNLMMKDIKQPINFNSLGYNECPNCTFSVEADDYYCSNCGQRIYLERNDVDVDY